MPCPASESDPLEGQDAYKSLSSMRSFQSFILVFYFSTTMFTFGSIISVAGLSSAFSSGIFQSISDYSAIFRNTALIPDVIATPQAFRSLSVQFPDSSSTNPYEIGHGYTRFEASRTPSFAMDPAGAGTFALINATFVIVAVDPDASTPQDRDIAQVRHFVGANYRISSTRTGALTNSTPALSEWIPPSPIVGSPHRYTVLAYLQPSGFEQKAESYISNNPSPLHFNLTDFMIQTGLAAPVGATFYLIGPDDQPAHTVAGQKSAFEVDSLVPSAIPTFDPIAMLDASFPSVNGSTFLAGIGENLTVPNVAGMPQFLLSFNTTVAPMLSGQSFVLAILDPDARSQNISVSDRVHLLASDMQFNSTLTAFAPLFNTTPAVAPYLAPNPPPDGPHRYTVLLYAQPENFVAKAAPLIPFDRLRVNWATFCQRTGLTTPIAGTFFRASQQDTIS